MIAGRYQGRAALPAVTNRSSTYPQACSSPATIRAVRGYNYVMKVIAPCPGERSAHATRTPRFGKFEEQVRKNVVTTTCTYDNNGNVTQKTTDGTTTTYVYDYANRLTALGVLGATTRCWDWISTVQRPVQWSDKRRQYVYCSRVRGSLERGNCNLGRELVRSGRWVYWRECTIERVTGRKYPEWVKQYVLTF